MLRPGTVTSNIDGCETIIVAKRSDEALLASWRHRNVEHLRVGDVVNTPWALAGGRHGSNALAVDDFHGELAFLQKVERISRPSIVDRSRTVPRKVSKTLQTFVLFSSPIHNLPLVMPKLLEKQTAGNRYGSQNPDDTQVQGSSAAKTDLSIAAIAATPHLLRRPRL
jgi:hypothetical protein